MKLYLLKTTCTVKLIFLGLQIERNLSLKVMFESSRTICERYKATMKRGK